MGDRSSCIHVPETYVSILLEFCVRCQGWRYVRYDGGWRTATEPGLNYDKSEQHFLEIEAADPYELGILIQRAFRAAQELECDAHNI